MLILMRPSSQLLNLGVDLGTLGTVVFTSLGEHIAVSMSRSYLIAFPASHLPGEKDLHKGYLHIIPGQSQNSHLCKVRNHIMLHYFYHNEFCIHGMPASDCFYKYVLLSNKFFLI